jgi:hypothetical protein
MTVLERDHPHARPLIARNGWPHACSRATEGEVGLSCTTRGEALSVQKQTNEPRGGHPPLVYRLSSACRLWAPGDRSFDRCRPGEIDR